ncbi:RbsD/FucU family protein [Litorihabitans aurantiacus]|uniref:Fucose dissimilation pathway protein n=1 Tax=Litorihabitans aurantiacus TaxID=1930061 RepID=A0AA37XFC6_9MICO|nr:RbsD/FucU domain-containing protein [Litorihabitans aurantiacus]GMA31972.1 fucose dissimilation pathway protein [Litorihabitans aurantiacus]
MLHGIHPALSGDLLRALDHLGHGETLLVCDGNYPAHARGELVLDVALDAPVVVGAVRTLVPLDTYEGPAVHLMGAVAGDDEPHEVRRALLRAVAAPRNRVEALERHAFYDLAATARLVVRTAETRPYGNLLMRKGVVSPTAALDTGRGPA